MNIQKESSEKRYFPRWKVSNRVLFRLISDGVEREAQTDDISCAGVCINTKERYLPKDKVRLTIYLSDGEKVSLSGRVIWHKNYGISSQTGINFEEVDQKSQDLLLKHAFEIDKTSVIKHWFKGWGGR